MIVLINRKARSIALDGRVIEIGSLISSLFPPQVAEKVGLVIKENRPVRLNGREQTGLNCTMEIRPLSGRFRSNGAVLALGQGE